MISVITRFAFVQRVRNIAGNSRKICVDSRQILNCMNTCSHLTLASKNSLKHFLYTTRAATPLQTTSCVAHRVLSTSSFNRRQVPSSTGFRPASDHRGNITPGNRPDSDFILNKEDCEGKEDSEAAILDDADYAEMLHNAEGYGSGVVAKASLRGGVFVVLPWIKWGPQQNSATTSELMLEEACALVRSLRETVVLGKEIVKIRYDAAANVFGTGQLNTLVDKARQLRGLSAVFVSVDVLPMHHIRMLEAEFGVRVVDRYWVVLSIFYQHARTLEARMQVSLAELSYIRSRTRHDSERAMLATRQRRLQLALKKLSHHRQHLRKARTNRGLPSVAVVGYTNAGKTTFISALSGDSSVQGEDHLFATLDVTAHGTRLPCGLQSVLLDTVGFIQDLPTTLVACFNATLQDAAHADVVVHVRDLSHPDRLMHHSTVMSALYAIGLPSTTPIITLDNKADLVLLEHDEDSAARDSTGHRPQTLSVQDAASPGMDMRRYCSFLDYDAKWKFSSEDEGVVNTAPVTNQEMDELEADDAKSRVEYLKQHYHSTPSLVVSAKTKKGLLGALEAIEEQVLTVTNRRRYRMKLPTGGDQIRVLRNIVGMAQETIMLENPEKTEVVCAMTEPQLARFKRECRQMADARRQQPSTHI